MTHSQKIKLEVQQLAISGFTQERIAHKLNISESTVFRTLKKLRKGSSQWLTNLAEQDLAHIFHESLQGFQQDLMHLNDLLDDPKIQDNPKLQIQIRREISNIRSQYLKALTQAPMVWSLAIFTSKYSPEPIIQPTMKSLDGISGV